MPRQQSLSARLSQRLAASQVGFTLIELLASLAMIALLVGLSLPALNGARQRAASAKCGSQMRQVAMALLEWADDNDGTLPQRYYHSGNIGYPQLLITNGNATAAIFKCPSQPQNNFPSEPSYGMNWYYDNAALASVAHPSQTILLAETLGPQNTGSCRADEDSGAPGELAPTRHQGKANYAYMDGHIAWEAFSDTTNSINAWGIDQGNHNQPVPVGYSSN